MTYLHTLPLFFYFVLCPWKHIIHVSFYHLKRHFLPWIHVLQEINYKINDTFFSHNLLQISWTYTFFFKNQTYLIILYIAFYYVCVMFDLLNLYSSKCRNKSFCFHQEKTSSLLILLFIIVIIYNQYTFPLLLPLPIYMHFQILWKDWMITGETVYIRINIYIIP